MSDDLRTRIAAAIEKDAYRQSEWWDELPHMDELADAVITELEADYILVPKSHTLARRAAAWQLTRWGIENQPDDD